MRWSNSLIKTMRDSPANATSKSHKLMLRANMMLQENPGVHSILPLGLRVLKNIETIIREEMNAIGSQEILMPALVSRDLWQETGQ